MQSTNVSHFTRCNQCILPTNTRFFLHIIFTSAWWWFDGSKAEICSCQIYGNNVVCSISSFVVRYLPLDSFYFQAFRLKICINFASLQYFPYVPHILPTSMPSFTTLFRIKFMDLITTVWQLTCPHVTSSLLAPSSFYIYPHVSSSLLVPST
jgi:hypothetical protein